MPGGETGTAHRLGVKRPARPLDELVELMRVEHRVQASVKWVRGRRRQIGGGDPKAMLTPPLASSAIAMGDSVYAGSILSIANSVVICDP